MQEQTEKKNSNSSSRVLLLGFVVIIAASSAYLFWPTVKGTAVLSKDVSLTGIFYTEDNPLAIVDGKIVHEEDIIGDLKVLKIYKDKVEFERSGRRWSQSMPIAKEGVSSNLPILLVLGSYKCPPCKKMMPILDELKTKYAEKFRVNYIDVVNNRAAGSEYGVRATPTQIFYDSNGREVFRNVGFCSKKDILGIWRQLGVKL
jgi:thioredoxin 1